MATHWNVQIWINANPEYKYRGGRGKWAEYSISFGHFRPIISNTFKFLVGAEKDLLVLYTETFIKTFFRSVQFSVKNMLTRQFSIKCIGCLNKMQSAFSHYNLQAYVFTGHGDHKVVFMGLFLPMLIKRETFYAP